MLLKLSGEALGAREESIDHEVIDRLAREIAKVKNDLQMDVALVVGGGNIWRGLSGASDGMDRAQSDYMGMLGTVINAPVDKARKKSPARMPAWPSAAVKSRKAAIIGIWE